MLQDNHFLFAALDGLWTSDGTETGTVQLLDDCIVNSSSLLVTKSAAFFQCNGGLWKSDGTPQGTEMVLEWWPWTPVAASDAILFFANQNESDYELWALNAQTLQMKLIARYVFTYGLVDDTLYFYQHHPGEDMGQLLRTDGTLAGTKFLAKSSYIGAMYPVRDRLYFLQNETNGTSALWITDGTANGTRMVSEGWPYSTEPRSLTTMNDIVYFAGAKDGSGRDLWKTNGTSTGTIMVKEFSGDDNNPSELTALGNFLFFSAGDGTHGRELWASDGSEAGTIMLADINPAPNASSSPYHLAARGKRLFFSADDGQHGQELWALELGDEPQQAIIHLPLLVNN